MSLIQLGLVDMTGALDVEMVQEAAAALNIQVTRDLPQHWNISATVRYLPHRSKIPAGLWPVQLVAVLPPGKSGFHQDRHNQPYAKVVAKPGHDEWTIGASHEMLEMLVDPSGNRLQSSVSIEIVEGKIQDGTGQFEYLVEACDPCQADIHAYQINGIAVSDFITPHFYDPAVMAGTRYSFTGAVTAPRQILPGGYISWVNQETDHWAQLQYIDPAQPPTIQELGPAPHATKSMRGWIDGLVESSGALQAKPKNPALLDRLKERRRKLSSLAEKRAGLY